MSQLSPARLGKWREKEGRLETQLKAGGNGRHRGERVTRGEGR